MGRKMVRLATAFGLTTATLTGIAVTAGPPAIAAAGTALPTGFGAIAVDAAHSHVFVSSPTSGTVTVLDFTGHVVATISGEAGPSEMVVNGSTVYVLLTTGGAIDAFDTTTFAKTAALGRGLVNPSPLVMAGGKLWTSTGKCGNQTTQLASVDISSGVVQSWPPPSGSSMAYCVGLASDPANPNLLLGWDLGLEPATISSIDVSTGVPVFTASVWEQDQGNLKQIAVNPDGATFVTASGSPYQLDEFRLSDLGLDGVIYKTGNYPNAVATTSARGGLIIGGRDNAGSNAVDTFHPGRPGTDLFTSALDGHQLYDRGLALSPDGSLLFAVTGDPYGTKAASFNVVPIANSTATSLSASPTSASSGQAVTLTASVTATSGFGPPTGSVTFSDGQTPIGSVTLTNGQATLTTSSLAVGSHVITASYGGDADNQASTSAPVTVAVGMAPTATSVSSSVNPSLVGQAVAFIATVTGGSTPTGTVTFEDGSTTIGDAKLTNGQATLTVSTLGAGAHSITAVYRGDTSNAGSTSAAIAQTVNKNATTTALTSSPNPSTYGQGVTFTATVLGAAPTGTVTFADGGVVLGTGVVQGGTATFTTSGLSVGSHSVTATYGGDAANTSSASASVTPTVNKVTSSTTVASSANPAKRGRSVTFTATVSASQPGSAAGMITFTNGSAVLGTVNVTGTTASLTTSFANAGSYQVTATFSGNQTTTSSSATIVEQVTR